MSNKRQTEISPKLRSEFISIGCEWRRSKWRCNLSMLRGIFICGLLLTTLITCANAKHNLKFDGEIQLNSKSAEYINDSSSSSSTTAPHENERNANHLENAHFYHSELQRLPYETINRILRDDREPIFRREDIDLRYYHTRPLQPTHEIVRRSSEEMSNLNLHAQNLSDFNVTIIPSKQLETILTIDMSENLLKAIELNDFPNLISANLSQNLLVQIPITGNSTIELLNLNSNLIQKGQLPQNENLRALYLSNNSIENLIALNLSLLNALETLDLSCNRIKNLETTFFPRLMHNLKYLNLAYNRLGSISRETFYNLLSLNTLLLAHNNINFIDYETFLSLPNLQYLDLSHNQLRGESIRALQGIPDLVGLSIAYNPDMGESLQEFVASWSLKEVDASGTGLCQIPAALAQAVRTLRLADNWFKIINCGDLDSYPLLQHLDLSYSRIEDIEDDAMGRLEFLEVLFLDHNRLHKVPVSLPTSLEHLFLQYNEIMDLQVQSFAGLRNLKTLDLSHNKVLYLPALPLPKLLTLNLQASGLQGLNQAIVHSLPHLRDLLLEENPIKCSDLLGIAEWASPCRIAERSSNMGKASFGNLDVGQQQTVAKIDLKHKFVQTHNFYEKFSSIGGNCLSKNAIGEQTFATTTPPICAVELDAEVKRPTVLEMTTRNAVNVVGEKVEQPKLSLVQHEATKATTTAATTATSTEINVHSNENRKVNEQNFGILHANATKLEKILSTSQMEGENSTFINSFENGTPKAVVTTEPTTQISVNQTTTLSTPIVAATTVMQTQKYATTMSTQSSNDDTDMPDPTISTTKTQQTILPTMPMSVPTTLISPASDLKYIAEGRTNMRKNLVPQRMPKTMPVSNYGKQNSRTPATSLLDRQRRVEIEHTTSKPTETTLTMHKTLPTIRTTEGSKTSLTQHSGNIEHYDNVDDNKNRKSLEIVNSSHGELLSTLATNSDQHKHASLQFHIKDRHLIGTPLLTHLGQNLLIAAAEHQSNPNHPIQKGTITATATTRTTTAAQTVQKNWTDDQTTQLDTKIINNLEVDGKQTTGTILKTTPAPMKVGKKLYNEMKKKPSLMMKKMTITTKHANSTMAPIAKLMHDNPIIHHQQHHHYTLNTPRENEVTPIVKSQGKFFQNSNHPTNLEPLLKHQFHHSNIKHSTVNTPIINGHEHELQTFHEHNELEETAAAAAHASTSAIVGKITKLGSTATSTSAKWYDLRKTTASAAHPGIVILLSFGLFVVLLIGLLHVYRCDIPWPLRRQRHQQRPYRIHQQQLQPQQKQQRQQRLNNQTNFNDDDAHSFLSYQSNSSSNQFNQRKWRLETTQKQQSTKVQQQQNQHHQLHSPLQNLHVRELQPTSAIQSGPINAKQPFKITNALGERSNSQTSSTCSPHSSEDIFDDETFYIEMTANMGQTLNSDVRSLSNGDFLPMELLNISKEKVEDKTKELEISNQSSNSNAFQTSSLDEHVATLLSNSKVTPTSRKLGLW